MMIAVIGCCLWKDPEIIEGALDAVVGDGRHASIQERDGKGRQHWAGVMVGYPTPAHGSEPSVVETTVANWLEAEKKVRQHLTIKAFPVQITRPQPLENRDEFMMRRLHQSRLGFFEKNGVAREFVTLVFHVPDCPRTSLYLDRKRLPKWHVDDPKVYVE